MATQAKQMRTRIASLGQISIADLKSRIADLGKSLIASFDENLRIAIAVKLMVKMKNFFRLKDGPGPCFEDAKVKQRLSVHSKL
jgi:hypothetical protein